MRTSPSVLDEKLGGVIPESEAPMRTSPSVSDEKLRGDIPEPEATMRTSPTVSDLFLGVEQFRRPS